MVYPFVTDLSAVVIVGNQTFAFDAFEDVEKPDAGGLSATAAPAAETNVHNMSQAPIEWQNFLRAERGILNEPV